MTEFDKVIPPGGVGKVTASVNTDHLKGPVAKSITVTSNDPDNGTVVLTFKADIKVPIDVQPGETVVIAGKAGALEAKELTVTAVDGKPFDILEVKKVGTGVDVKIHAAPTSGKTVAPAVADPQPVAAGSDKYVVTIVPSSDVKPGRNFMNVTLATSHAKQKSISLNVSFDVKGEVEVVPERLFFIAVSDERPESKLKHVVLKKPQGDPLAIVSVDSADPDFKTTLKTVTEGREYDVEVTYVGKPGRGQVSTNVSIKTNVAQQETINIPINGRIDSPQAAAPAAAPVATPGHG